MALKDLVGRDRVSPFTEEDRISHTTKMVERTFGVSVSDLGTVQMDGDRAVLVIEHNGEQRRLSWRRGQRGAIFWYLDDSDRPIVLSGGNNPLARLQASLDI